MKMNFRLRSSPMHINTVLYGNLSIKGQVKEKNIPIPCRVRLFEKLSGRLVFDVETDENGFYVFNNLNQVLFYAITHHPLNQFNALIFDNLMPK